MADKPGFDGPLKILTQMDVNSLKGLLAKHAPIGKKRSQTISGITRLATGKRRGTRGSFTYRNAPPAPGRLRKSFFKSGAVKLNRQKTGIEINIDLPYAGAIDQGRRAVTIKPKVANRLMFKLGNRIIFAKKVTQPARRATNAGKGFVKPAVKEWLERRGLRKRGVEIVWDKGKKGLGATVGRAGGLVK